jgi:hypothetical protein
VFGTYFEEEVDIVLSNPLHIELLMVRILPWEEITTDYIPKSICYDQPCLFGVQVFVPVLGYNGL